MNRTKHVSSPDRMTPAEVVDLMLDRIDELSREQFDERRREISRLREYRHDYTVLVQRMKEH